MAQIIGFFGAVAPQRRKKTWSNQDLAELYRVQSSLVQSGLRIDTEQGETDEGEPWFIFCHADSGEVIVHFALIDDRYVVATPALPHLMSGTDLESIVRKFVDENPVSLPRPERERKSNVIFHPSALLTIFVATLLLTFRPDESLAAGGREWEEEENEAGVFPLAAKDEEGGAFGEDQREYRTGEKAFLFAAVVMAIEIARIQGVEKPESFVQLSHLEGMFHALQIEKNKDEGQTKLVLDALDVYVGDSEGAEATEAAIEGPEVEFVELVALLEHEAGLSADVSAIHVDVHAAEAAKVEAAEKNAILPEQPPVVAAAIPAEITPVEIVSHAREAVAANWLEDKASSAGLSIALLEQNSSAVAALAVKLVDSAEIVDSVELVDSDTEGTSSQKPIEGPVSWTAILTDYDEKDGFRVISHFLSSDEDIDIVEHGEGSVVIFDRSDVTEQKSLQMHIWVFEDTQITILAHSDTIADALSMMV